MTRWVLAVALLVGLSGCVSDDESAGEGEGMPAMSDQSSGPATQTAGDEPAQSDEPAQAPVADEPVVAEDEEEEPADDNETVVPVDEPIPDLPDIPAPMMI